MGVKGGYRTVFKTSMLEKLRALGIPLLYQKANKDLLKDLKDSRTYI